MRLAILSLDKGGGCAHCAYELARAMEDKAAVTCFLPMQTEMSVDFGTLHCQLRLLPMRRGPRALVKSLVSRGDDVGIARAIMADHPDVVLDTGSGAWGEGVLRQLSGRIPTAQIVHDVSPHPDLRSLVYALPTMLGTPSADILVALSEFSYQQLSRKYPHKQCIRSRHGIILSASHIDVAAVAARRNKQLFFGRIFPYKGITTLLNAFAIAQRIDPAIELTIVGRGRLGTRLLRQIAGLDVHLDNRYVPDNEIKGILASHGVIVLPYSSATQSGVAALALGNGIPCIATNVGALPEQIIHGRNGLLVPPRDPESLARAMVAVSGNADLARQMAIEARSVGKENYSWNDIGQLLLEDLARCLYHSANGR